MQTKIFVGVAIAIVLIQAGCSTKDRSREARGGAASENTVGSVPNPAPSPVPNPPEVAKPLVTSTTIPEGTRIVVRTTSAISTKTQLAGQTFVAYLVQPLIEAGRNVIPKGTEMEGLIVDSNRGGRVKGRASLSVRLTGFRTAGGNSVKIATDAIGYSARATKGKDTAKIGIGAGIGAALGGIFGGGKGAAIGAAAGGGGGTGLVLATHGDAAVIPSETVLSFVLRESVTFVN